MKNEVKIEAFESMFMMDEKDNKKARHTNLPKDPTALSDPLVPWVHALLQYIVHQFTHKSNSSTQMMKHQHEHIRRCDEDEQKRL